VEYVTFPALFNALGLTVIIFKEKKIFLVYVMQFDTETLDLIELASL